MRLTNGRKDQAVSPADLFEVAFQAPSDGTWFIGEDRYEPALEHEIESRFAITNGYLGVRGSLDQPTSASHPGTYIAGLFQRLENSTATPSLFNAGDCWSLNLSVDGEPLAIERGTTLEYHRLLDFRRGLLLNCLRQLTDAGTEVVVRSLRFASLTEVRAVGQLATIEISRPARLRLAVGAVRNSSAPSTSADGPMVVPVPGAQEVVAVSSNAALTLNGRVVPVARQQLHTANTCWDAQAGQVAQLRRVVAFAAAASPELASRRARETLSRPAALFPELYERHVREWERRWRTSDMIIEGDEQSQRALRFAIYHLISATPQGERASVGARALTGEAYKGHVFWDADIFLAPFYALTRPRAARAMLMYRFYTLPAARQKAQALGYRGALFAWESADTGEETTPPFALGPRQEVTPILSGTLEHHVSADVAYAVWRYWQVTGDSEFLIGAGAEIILETSRFWASRARAESDGAYHIRNVIGPDEYHEDVDDNAFTNGMAAFNLECGVLVARLLQARWPQHWKTLAQRLSVTPAELSEWDIVREKLFKGFDSKALLFEQFAGYFSREEIDLRTYTSRTAPMDELLGKERTGRSQVIKQADVVMLLALLGERYDHRVRLANFLYYEPRTGHGSSLSPPIHAMVCARLGMVELAKRFFDDTAAIDLSDTMGNAAGGVHIGALGGLWQIVAFGFAGLQPYGTELTLEPQLPPTWRRLSFPIRWRRRLVRVSIEDGGESVQLELERGAALPIRLGDLRRRLSRGATLQCSRDLSGIWREVSA